jgi:hypothetical protein
MRRLLVLGGMGLGVAGCGAGDGTAPPPPPNAVSATPTASGNGQAGAVATALPLPLRVLVYSAGTRKAGVTVTWHTSDGLLAPQASVTDAAGIATATWTLDTVVGTQSATASVAGLNTVRFRATALAGPAALIQKVLGDSQTMGVNARFSSLLGVFVTDRYRNAVSGQAVTWTVVNGPVSVVREEEFGTATTTDVDGYATTSLRPGGTEGGALVRASLRGGGAAADFSVTVGPPQYLVRLIGLSFMSVQNGTSTPAIDTVPAGQTVQWLLGSQDYPDGLHRLISVGTPTFVVPGSSNAFPSTVSVTLTQPGTYDYTDFYNPRTATGVIVVR